MKAAGARLGAAAILAVVGCGVAAEPEAAPADAAALAAGERAFQKCYACHAIEPGRNDLTGPTLHAIVGRRIAAQPGFDYSPALRGFAEDHPIWTEDLLGRFIEDPEMLVPGTSMTFHGITSRSERQALLAYLNGTAE